MRGRGVVSCTTGTLLTQGPYRFGRSGSFNPRPTDRRWSARRRTAEHQVVPYFVLLMCRFLGRRDAGLSPRADGRRRRSAKARSRGNWGMRVQRALWRFNRSAGVDCGLAIDTDVHANTISARWTVGERLCEPPLGGFATPLGCFRPSRIVAGAGPADRSVQVASG
jgi:hypothetical protein